MVSAEEVMIRNILVIDNRLHECFIGYYYGIHDDKEAIRIDKSTLRI